MQHEPDDAGRAGDSSFAPRPQARSERIPSHWIVLYALPSLVSSVAALPMALFVPAFYAENLGVPLAAVGVAIAASRLLDVVTDPLIGTLSDRFGFAWGRRKPWMIAGTPIFALAIWQVFVPGETANATHLLVWSAILYLGFTMIDLPHKAWGAELSTNYDERSRITSWREALSTAGQVGLLAALAWMSASGIDDAATQLRGMAWVVIVALPVLVLVAARSVPEGAPERVAHPHRSFVGGLKLVALNPAFGRMVGCVFLFVSGIAIQGTLHRLVLSDVMGDDQNFPIMILAENIATLAAVPLWLRISLWYGKHRALIVAALWIAILSLPLALLGPGDTTTLIVLIAIRGSSFASILFLSNSIAADVIDVDTLESGEQRSGLYFAVWGMAIKFSLAAGVLLGTTVPSLFGYEPSAEATAAPVQRALMGIYGILPAILMMAGVLFLRGFPITRERHAEVRAELETRIRVQAEAAGDA